MLRTHMTHREMYKEAGANNQTRLSPDVKAWPLEVTSRLIKDHPYLSKYTTQVALDETDRERLYCIGHVRVSYPDYRNQASRSMRIPFVVENQRLYPLKVFMDPSGRLDLLNKDVFSRAMMRPEIGLMTSAYATSKPSLWSATEPPVHDTQRGAMGGHRITKVATDQAGANEYFSKLAQHLSESGLPWLGKHAEVYLYAHGETLSPEERVAAFTHSLQKMAVEESGVQGEYILDRLNGLVDEEQLGEFRKKAHVLRAWFGRVPAHSVIAKTASSLQPGISSREEEVHTPDLVSVQVEWKGGDRYRIKMASLVEEIFSQTHDDISATDAAALVGEDRVAELEEDGKVTMTSVPAVQKNLDDVRVEQVKDYGIWKVQRLTDGQHMLGAVITNVVNFGNVSQPWCIFTNGDAWALQENIAGSRLGGGTNLPRKAVESGDVGFFFKASFQGRITATVPVEVQQVVEMDGRMYFDCVENSSRKRVRLTYGPEDMKKIVKVGPDTYTLPGSMSFSPLGEETKLVTDVPMFSKMAARQKGLVPCELSYNGQYHLKTSAFRDPNAAEIINKTASDVEHLLSLLGVPVQESRDYCKQASRHQTSLEFYVTPLPVISGIKEASEAVTKDREEVIALARDMDWVTLAAHIPPLQEKTASALPNYAGPNSVDAILSLNFINDANLGVFVDAIPSLVSARRTLAELYACRMIGLEDVELSAIVSGMDHLHKVIRGLSRARMRLSI